MLKKRNYSIFVIKVIGYGATIRFDSIPLDQFNSCLILVYIIQYKENPLIYYIGRSALLKYRLRSHRRPSHVYLKDKFHIFANLVGWDKFTVSIVEFCENDQQEIREKFYLNKYLPCLNTVFQSKVMAKSVNRSLYKTKTL